MLHTVYWLFSPHLLAVALLGTVWAAYLCRRGVREGPLWLLGPVVVLVTVASLGVMYRLDAESMHFCINSGPLPPRQAASVVTQQRFHAHGLGLLCVIAATSAAMARRRARCGLGLLALGAGLLAGAAGLDRWIWLGLWEYSEAQLLERAVVLPRVYALAVTGVLAWGAGLLVLWRDQSLSAQRRGWTRVLVLLALVTSACAMRALLYASAPAGNDIPGGLLRRGLPELEGEASGSPIDFRLTDTIVKDAARYIVVYQGHPASESAMRLRPVSEDASPMDSGIYVIDPRYKSLDRRFSLLMVKAVVFQNVWDSAAYRQGMREIEHTCYGCGPSGERVNYKYIAEIAFKEGGFWVDDRWFEDPRAVTTYLAQREAPLRALLLHPEGMRIEDIALLCGAGRASDCAVAWD